MPHAISSVQLVGLLRGWHQSRQPLYRALADAVRGLIDRGALPPHTRLPSERSLAVTLSVSRGTVTSAYELLREENYAITRHGSGSLVNPARSPLTGPREGHIAAALPPTAARTAATGGVIDLADAVHHRPAEPRRDRSDGEVGRRDEGHTRPEHLTDQRACSGYDLRRLLAAHLSAQGLPTNSDDLLITGGGQQALTLVMMVHVGRNDRVVLEELTYPGALHAALLQEAAPVRVRRGAGSPDLDELASAIDRWAPRALYVMATGHATDGGVMPGAARQRVADMAAASGLLVIDDLSMAPTTQDVLTPPPLAAFADARAAHRFVTIGSLGKTLGPNHRLGWIRAHPEQLDRLARVQTVVGLGATVDQQTSAARLLSTSDVFADHTHASGRRRMHMAARLADALPEWRVQRSNAGMSLWVRLPTEVAGFLNDAERFGLRLAPPSSTSAATRDGHHLRLAVGHPLETLDEATDRLAQAWQAHSGRRVGAGQRASRIAG